ncbi:MAG: protein kinase [Candidatus Brocadiae bacterium]|nr:protein kinase [Candidatus Brocadiia bacterium]
MLVYELNKGKYIRGERIGKGGFGTVYYCQEENKEGIYALKIGHEPATEKKEKESFDREIGILRLLQEKQVKGIVKLIDWGYNDERPCLVMEYIEGKDWLSHCEGKTEIYKVVILERVIHIIQKIHEFRISENEKDRLIHRDIKPENVRVNDAGKVVLLDFGLAKFSTALTSMTAKQPGTQGYMSPEQEASAEIKQAADIWPLGVMLYQAIEGELPFHIIKKEENKIYPKQEDQQKLYKKGPEFKAIYWKNEGKGLQEICRKALELDWRKRIDAKTMKDLLQGWRKSNYKSKKKKKYYSLQEALSTIKEAYKYLERSEIQEEQEKETAKKEKWEEKYKKNLLELEVKGYSEEEKAKYRKFQPPVHGPEEIWEIQSATGEILEYFLFSKPIGGRIQKSFTDDAEKNKIMIREALKTIEKAWCQAKEIGFEHPGLPAYQESEKELWLDSNESPQYYATLLGYRWASNPKSITAQELQKYMKAMAQEEENWPTEWKEIEPEETETAEKYMQRLLLETEKYIRGRWRVLYEKEEELKTREEEIQKTEQRQQRTNQKQEGEKARQERKEQEIRQREQENTEEKIQLQKEKEDLQSQKQDMEIEKQKIEKLTQEIQETQKGLQIKQEKADQREEDQSKLREILQKEKDAQEKQRQNLEKTQNRLQSQENSLKEKEKKLQERETQSQEKENQIQNQESNLKEESKRIEEHIASEEKRIAKYIEEQEHSLSQKAQEENNKIQQEYQKLEQRKKEILEECEKQIQALEKREKEVLLEKSKAQYLAEKARKIAQEKTSPKIVPKPEIPKAVMPKASTPDPLPDKAQKKSEDKRYKVLSSGIIQDTKTGLEWLIGPDKDTDWNEAKAWVDKIDTSKYGTGWRMPGREELKNIYESDKGANNVDPVIYNNPNNNYLWVWTVELKDGSSSAWVFDFSGGRVYWGGVSYRSVNRVFAVRSGRQ